ncbi:hypothetical protein COLO4_28033 [Corchorus olitorius]|uniref:Uncharacterized protein n=1 Tax=Corchorus olitorius TaxID=93759 RepID=A0A1R3HN62_9ROSI|nr:hypothetical protein COLO4_28033 [Corchorus olitorius]
MTILCLWMMQWGLTGQQCRENCSRLSTETKAQGKGRFR